MATPAPNQRTASSVTTIPASEGPSASRWGRNGEPGSAFRGLSRGSRGSTGRGGGGRGRGGRGGGGFRGGRGQGDSSHDKSVTTPVKAESSPVTKPAGAAALPTSASEKPSAPVRPKAPSRRASRSVPALVVAPVPSVEGPPSTTSVRPPNRRKRSSTHNRMPASPALKSTPPPLDEDLLRPTPRARPHSAPAKDTPPHFVASFDMRNNIDALVERVRAVAMADNRPTTPGSHIDWAGDDDDSLPDLDDWGVTTGTSTVHKDETISPIIVDGLKPLPEPIAKSLTPPRGEADLIDPSSALEPRSDGTVLLDLESDEKDEFSPANIEMASQSVKAPEERKPRYASHPPRPLHLNARHDNTSTPPAFPADKPTGTSSVSSAQKTTSTASEPSKVPLHPSLPPKPAAAVESPVAQSRLRHGATAIRNDASTQPLPLPDKPASKLVESSAAKAAEHSKPIDPVVVNLPVEAGIAQSIHAHSPTEPTQNGNLFTDDKPREGLAASIHAPKGLSDSFSAPSDLSSHASVPTAHRAFNPTHNRAQTVDPPSFPKTAPTFPLSQRFSRSGTSTPRGAFSHHARNHSSPPAGSVHRTPHATRPVITGDAISRLARTIGSTSISPGRTTTVSKD